MIDSLWPQSHGSDRPLPEPTVEVPTNGTRLQGLTEAQIRGILTNPIYAGVGPYPPMVEESRWVRCCKKLIDEEGAEQFLVNLLYVLRKSFLFQSQEPQ
ncbi:MAG: hypothetical protein HY000_15725 [Planctomycetes bacterium]|nr:hypothetical protein [Planctomycetota bacterium]